MRIAAARVGARVTLIDVHICGMRAYVRVRDTGARGKKGSNILSTPGKDKL